MTNSVDKETLNGPNKAAAKKKPYKAPAFRHERVFVTSALACGKIQDTQDSCRHNRKAS